MREQFQEALPELGMKLQFFAAEASQGFYFARTTWHIPRNPEDVPHRSNTHGSGIGLCVEDFPVLAYREVCANILYRKAFALKSYRREAAYCLALYTYTPSAYLVILERALDAVLAHLPAHGYTGSERWFAEEYKAYSYFISPAHQDAIWNSNQFGVVLH